MRWIDLGLLVYPACGADKTVAVLFIANHLCVKATKYVITCAASETDGRDSGVVMLLLVQPELWYGGSVVCDYAGDVVPGGSEIVAVHFHYRYGHISGCVADTRRTAPYPPCYRILEPVGRSFGSGYQLTQSLMAFGRGELWGQRFR